MEFREIMQSVLLNILFQSILADIPFFEATSNVEQKGMATYSSVLAWRISWTEEPGGLQSMGSQKSDTTE